jgi:hypothetical protein
MRGEERGLADTDASRNFTNRMAVGDERLHVPERIRSSPDWLPLGSDISPPPSPSALALPPFGLADFDLRVLRHELLGNERDSHAPSRIHAE